MESKKIFSDDLGDKIIKGMRIAFRRLVEKTAAEDGELVIGGDDGKPKRVPAKEILKQLQREDPVY